MQYTIKYSEELDLWGVYDDGFLFKYYVFKWKAVKYVKELNKAT